MLTTNTTGHQMIKIKLIQYSEFNQVFKILILTIHR